MTTLSMNLTSIDTLAFSKRMQKAGLSQQTADELAEALKESQSQSIENFATKMDLDHKIDQSESKLEQKIELVRKDLDVLRKEVELSKQEVIIKLGRVMYLGIAFLATLISLAVALLKI
jgi:hypothetical protein